MSKINIIPLGGVQELGKNLYILEIDNKAYILDCGLKYPSADLRGIDCIINDTSYIEQNIKKFVGIFLTSAANTSLGGVTFLVKNYRLRVYGSRFTIAVLKSILEDDGIPDLEELLVEVEVKTPLTFYDTVIRAFEVSNNLPQSFGYSFKTKDGYIIFAEDYNFDQNSRINYTYMYRELAVFAKEGVLALMTSSQGALNDNSRGTILELSIRLRNIIASAKKRIIVSVYSKDILRIQQVCNIAMEYNKKIAIIGRRAQKLVSTAFDLDYIKIPDDSLVNLRYITDDNDNDVENLVVIVPGERHEVYHMLNRMAKGHDRLINLKETDTVIMLTNAEIGTEKMEAKTLDTIYRQTSIVKTFNTALLPEACANREELKQMINILKPKYIIPIAGEYRHQFSLIEAAKCIEFPEDRVIVSDNGDVLSFVDGKYQGVKATVPSGEVLIDGKAINDVADVVLKDREILSQDGLVIISANVNPRTKTILCGPEVVTRGFIFIRDNAEVIDNIKNIFLDVSQKYLKAKFINWNDYKTDVKSEVAKYIYKEMKRNPIIIPVLLSTELNQ